MCVCSLLDAINDIIIFIMMHAGTRAVTGVYKVLVLVYTECALLSQYIRRLSMHQCRVLLPLRGGVHLVILGVRAVILGVRVNIVQALGI